MKRARHKTGSVVFNKRSKTWHFLWCMENGSRTSRLIGTKAEYATKTAARTAAEPIRRELMAQPTSKTPTVTVAHLVTQYRIEKMPKRASTRRGYETYIENHILPQWGQSAITDVQARPVELWLDTLDMAPKSKAHIRGLLHILWDYAMWRGDAPTERNPMELVTVKSASKRVRKPRSLTVEEFHALLQYFENNRCVRTTLLLAVSFGLRISEVLGLKWADVDWLGKSFRIERGIVKQIVDDVKTDNSAKTMEVCDELLDVLREWRKQSQFTEGDDWMFASPVQLGRLPISYSYIYKMLVRAVEAVSIAHISTHTFRHTHRMWLDAVGTPIGVQQRAMRHADIRTTMNIYGDAMPTDLRQAREKVARMALPSAN